MKDPSQKQSKPLPEQLAQASWLAPIVFVAMNVVLNQAPSDGGSSRSVVVTIVGYSLFTLGFVCGVAALFFIRSHGKKGILIPALVGAVLCGTLLFFSGRLFWKHYTRHKTPQMRLEREAGDLKRGLPKTIDEETSWDAVSTREGQLIFDYSLVNYSSEQIDGGVFADNQRPTLLGQVCESMRGLLDSGASFRARYSGMDEVVIAEIVIESSDCASAQD